ncbi:MAG: ice-binding family protein [bacterium]|nr:ice-binding family protein [bacterium]
MKKRKITKHSAATVAAAVFALSLPAQALAAPTVDLGTADDFAVLAGSAITNTPTSTITGDVGLSPASGSFYAGLTDAEVDGTIYAVDGAGPGGSVNDPGLLTTAKADLTTAYNDAAGRTTTSTIGSGLGGVTLTEGTYDSAAGTFALAVGTTLTLNGQGNADAVWIFKMASTLTTGSGSTVLLTNGAQACNVFWQVGSSATLGTNSTFVGNILALTSATLTTGAEVEGSVLAQNGAVTLDSNTITDSACALIEPPDDEDGDTDDEDSDDADDASSTGSLAAGDIVPKLPNAGIGPR